MRWTWLASTISAIAVSLALWLAHALCRGFASASALQSAFGLSLVAAGSALDTTLWIFPLPYIEHPLQPLCHGPGWQKDFQPFMLFSKAMMEAQLKVSETMISRLVAVDVSIILASARDAVMPR